jgi:uncharacterized protein (TIGR02117 family)
VKGQFSCLVLLLLIIQSGCATARVEQGKMDRPEKVVYVLGHGWHTGIVVKREDIPMGIWPERDDFPDAIYLEAGWGDKDFYLAPKASFGLALKAALQATPSVLHIVGFRIPAQDYYPQSDIIEVGLSQTDFENLCKFIHDTYQRDANGRAIYLGRGLTAHSSFYLAHGKYHLFNTCNNWVAKALKAAACPIRPGQATTAGNVIEQTRQFGRVIRATGVSVQDMGDVPLPSDE